jgi:hypothetical protein
VATDMVTVWLYPLPGAEPASVDGWRASIEYPGLFGIVAGKGEVPRYVWERYDYACRYGRRAGDRPTPAEALGMLADAMFENLDGVMYHGERLTFQRTADA